MRFFALVIIFIISGLVLGLGLGTTAMAFNDYTKQIMETDCVNINIVQLGWTQRDMWCALLDNQQKIIEQNDRLIELQEQTNCLLLLNDNYVYEKELKCK